MLFRRDDKERSQAQRFADTCRKWRESMERLEKTLDNMNGHAQPALIPRPKKKD